MTGALAIVAGLAVLTSGAVVAWCLWLDDRRRRDRDGELIGEVHAARRATEQLARRSAGITPDEVSHGG